MVSLGLNFKDEESREITAALVKLNKSSPPESEILYRSPNSAHYLLKRTLFRKRRKSKLQNENLDQVKFKLNS